MVCCPFCNYQMALLTGTGVGDYRSLFQCSCCHCVIRFDVVSEPLSPEEIAMAQATMALAVIDNEVVAIPTINYGGSEGEKLIPFRCKHCHEEFGFPEEVGVHFRHQCKVRTVTDAIATNEPDVQMQAASE